MTESQFVPRAEQHILIVDDEPNILILMEQVLEELEEENDVILLTAKNGEDALALIVEKHPNLIFLDVMMPNLSGFELCQRVKESPELADTYIVLLTAKGQAFDKEHGLLIGADCYMTKPFRPKDILNKARHVLHLPDGHFPGNSDYWTVGSSRWTSGMKRRKTDMP